MKRFENKSVIVTGVASGFGRAIAEKFSSEGAKVIGADINRDNGDQVIASLVDRGGQAEFVEANVAVSQDVENMVNRCLECYGTIDILVNNAGFTHRSMLMWKLAEEDFE